MEQRKPGCICELNPETEEPVVANYAMCPVHKPDAPNPKDTAKRLVIMMDVSTETLAAIHCVDEIISVIEACAMPEYKKILIPFYKQVKEEIQKL